MDWDDYFLGFVKGLGIFFIFALALYFLNIVNGEIPKIGDPLNLTDFLFACLTLLFISYVITKNHEPRGWMLLAALFNIFILPFLFGMVEVNKYKRTA